MTTVEYHNREIDLGVARLKYDTIQEKRDEKTSKSKYSRVRSPCLPDFHISLLLVYLSNNH